ncbi:MAG TPA: DUF4360 domain-containing protein [Oligoflexus sp.]|uniref:DUF4360 domain-containing protein n=1 Tax=Oligoflexus sp. TaxID=1971216 RepID=UPI002D7E612B|nr:DUF4360 domain-containing protein [Oligoflexus sp.]HET9240335.1 DUF4360 domain-containing protein [Oligoflexus sp.]
MKMIQGTLVFFTLIATHGLQAAPEGAYLRSVVASGSGCPASSPELGVVLDQDELVMMLPSMLVEWGPGLAKVLSRKNCVITLDVAVPQGWQYSLGSWENSGFVKLDAGLRAEVGLQYFFEGGTGQRLSQIFQGPVESDFRFRDVFSIAAQSWSTCAAPRKLNINTLVRIQSNVSPPEPEARGFLELGSHWESNILKMQLNWRRCPV